MTTLPADLERVLLQIAEADIRGLCPPPDYQLRFLRNHGPALRSALEDQAMLQWLSDNCRPWDSGCEEPHALIRICVGSDGKDVGWIQPGPRQTVGITTLREAILLARAQEAGK